MQQSHERTFMGKNHAGDLLPPSTLGRRTPATAIGYPEADHNRVPAAAMIASACHDLIGRNER
jgi:hypothetical protein